MDSSQLYEMSQKAWHYAKTNHTKKNFTERYNFFVKKTIEQMMKDEKRGLI
jgi:hypothetical protein